MHTTASGITLLVFGTFMTKLIVHIGDGKCGSTAIQRSLHESHEALNKLAICYVTPTPNSGHFSLATLLNESTRGNAGQQIEYANRTLDLIRKQAKECEYIVVSAESLFSCQPENVYQLLASTADSIESFDIIAYVRPPIQMYLSLVQQQLKGSYKFTKPEQYLREINNVLGKWAESPLVSSLTVRNFDRKKLLQGDVVKDFEQCLIDLTGNTQIQLNTQSANQSLTAEQMIVLQRYRKNVLPKLAEGAMKESNLLVKLFESLNTGSTIGTRPSLLPIVTHIISAKNASIVDTVNSRFEHLKLHNQVNELSAESDDGDYDSDDEDVSSILHNYDPAVVQWLSDLVPEFNNDLLSADRKIVKNAVHAILDSRTEMNNDNFDCLKKFWIKEGCQSASEHIDGYVQKLSA